MAMGAWWAMKKSLLVKLSVYLLIIAMANCARDNPDSVANRSPVSIYTCDDITETWHGGLCAKHGTCNKPCRTEEYDSGFCAAFPFLFYCCCKKNYPEALQPRRRSFVCG
ncbi:defensin-like protein 81 [Triticum dicoccoides]|uniref:defensin-like protein 81 n=1 Tax=Triticum dicoccoides TaxID=85692 RepID=UPI00188FAA78|nr:defensin-like protein 81 [Triticum dicoccoides]